MGLTLGLSAAPALADPPVDGCHDHKDCPPGGDDETTPGGKHSPLIFTINTGDLENDGKGDYVHNEGHVKALAGGQNQPNKPGVRLDLRGGGGNNARKLTVDVRCTDGSFGDCRELPGGFLGEERPRVILSVRPYENSCPDDLLSGECPDIFTMSPDESEEMSFRILFHEGLIIEAASNIGGSTGPNPGRCLSLLNGNDRVAFVAACAGGDTCNVTVTASDAGDSAGSGAGDEENDAWEIRGTGVRAIICDLSTNTVIGETTITVELDAIKR